MNKESPWKKNPILNIGVLVMSGGMLMATFSDRIGTIGAVVAIVGCVMFFIGFRKAKASGAPPVPVSERQRKLKLLMICVAASFLVSPIILWPTICKLRGAGLWIFIIGDLVALIGILSFYVWLYKKAGRDKADGA
jgi:hypothetical protein